VATSKGYRVYVQRSAADIKQIKLSIKTDVFTNLHE